jgi:hypothetical protein
MSKKIVSMLRAGEGFVCIDNIVGRWSSPVLASLVTDGAINVCGWPFHLDSEGSA